MADSPKSESLSDLRDQIDAIDDQILQLLNRRAACAEAVAQVKIQQDPNTEFYRPEREAQILSRVSKNNTGPLKDNQITHLYREIIASCLALESSLCIAYLGPPGTFTEMATQKHFGRHIRSCDFSNIAEVFRAVESGQMRFGVVPVENSTQGGVTHTLDNFTQTDLNICGEIVLRIEQCLLGVNDQWQESKTIYSHPQSLAQCKNWITKNLPNAKAIECDSNAQAMQKARTDPEAVAIAGSQGAQQYELKLLETAIQDRSNNTTRFYVIGRHETAPSGLDKTSLLVSTPNKPGALFELLQPFADQGIDMTRIESRPSHDTQWDYVFFLDVKGHRDDPALSRAIDTLSDKSKLCRVLGSYPKAID